MTPASLYRLGFRDHPAAQEYARSEVERKKAARAAKALASGRTPGKAGRPITRTDPQGIKVRERKHRWRMMRKRVIQAIDQSNPAAGKQD
jgi:hypothetical protein